MLDVLTIGDVKRDTFVVVHDASIMCKLKKDECQICLDYGHKIPVEHFVTQTAGSAPNVAVGLARLGYKTAVLSPMGDDEIARDALRFLKREHVLTSHLTKTRGGTSSQSIVLNFQGESTQLAAHTSLTYVFPRRFPKLRAVHLGEMGDGYEALFQRLLAQKQQRPFLLSFNPGPIHIRERKPSFLQLLKQTDVLFLNASEARLILGHDEQDFKKLLRHLREFCRGLRVITDGARGAWAQQADNEPLFVPAAPAKLVEATGAGDAFATGVLAKLLQSKSPDSWNHNLLKDALHFASTESASVISHPGPTVGLLRQIK